MAETVTKQHTPDCVGVGVVWIPMLATDNIDAAQQIAALFRDANVRQFWDAKRKFGVAFSRHLFQGWARQAFADLEEQQRARETLYVLSDEPSAQWPAWDMVLFYGNRVEWTDHPPIPAHWVCQHAFYGARQDGTSGMFWRNDFRKEPFQSDWHEEVREGITRLLAPNSTNG